MYIWYYSIMILLFLIATLVKKSPDFGKLPYVRREKCAKPGGRLIVSRAISPLCEGVFVQRRRRRQKRVIGKLLEFSRLYRSRACRVGLTLEGDEKERDDRHAGGRGGGGSNDMVGRERRWCSAVALWGCWPSTWRRSFTDLPEKLVIPAPCADLRTHPRRQRIPLLKGPSGPKQTLPSPTEETAYL